MFSLARLCWEHSEFKRPTTTQINNAEYVRVTDMKIEIEGLDNFGTREVAKARRPSGCSRRTPLGAQNAPAGFLRAGVLAN